MKQKKRRKRAQKMFAVNIGYNRRFFRNAAKPLVLDNHFRSEEFDAALRHIKERVRMILAVPPAFLTVKKGKG